MWRHLAALLLAACLSLQARAQGMAIVADSAESYGPSSGIFFVLLAVNDQELSDNAIRAMRQASAGRGAYMAIRNVERGVPAGKVRLKLMGSIENVAPIQSIYRAIFHGGSPEFSGSIEVELQPGRRYRVAGVLDDFQREAWIEEADTRKVVSTKVVMPQDPELLKLMEGAQFLCCNIRYSGTWSDDTPAPDLPFLPAGSRIKVLDYSRNEAAVLINGKRMRIGNQYSRKQETIQQMIARLVVPEDPRLRLQTYDAQTRSAIVSAKVLPGMSREQVVMALGRPRPAETPDLAASDWLYQLGSGEEAFVVFGPDGRVKEVDASRMARGHMLAVRQPAAEPGTAPVPAPAASAAPPPAAASAPAPAAAASAAPR